MREYPDDADGDALANLAAQGLDMSQPLVLEFSIAAPDEQSAKSIADALGKQNYTPEIDFDEREPEDDPDASDDDVEDEGFGPLWSVYVKVTMVPEYDNVVAVQSELDRIAAPFGGQADGWGTFIERVALRK